MRKKLIWTSIIVTLLISSCKGPDYLRVDKRTNKFSSLEAFNYTLLNNFDKDISIKYTASIKTNESKHNVAGNIKIISDSLLWMNIVSRSMGIEIARILCKNDSLFFIDRLNKQYYKGDYSYLEKRLGYKLNLKQLSYLFTGKLIDYSFDYNNGYNRFISFEKDSNYHYKYVIDSINNEKTDSLKYPFISHNFILNISGYLLESNYLNINDSKELQLTYSNYSSNLPHNVRIATISENKEGLIELNYKEITKGVKSISFSVPTSYIQIK